MMMLLLATTVLLTTTNAFSPALSLSGSTSSSHCRAAASSSSTSPVFTTTARSSTAVPVDTTTNEETYVDAISNDRPLKVLIAGGGVGGLALANVLSKHSHMDVTVLEQASEFKRFGGPIQLASNAMQLLKQMDEPLFDKICQEFTITGNKENGIKDGIRTEWYAKFDLDYPARTRGLPYTGVIDRPDLQQLYLDNIPKGVVQNGDGVDTYIQKDNQVHVTLTSGKTITGDVLIGADGIWSAVRAAMRGHPRKGPDSGATYSGYTVFAGELAYDSPDNGQVGYKVYIGPGQYFVITDIGKGNYQWYAFLARPEGYADTITRPNNSTSLYLQDIFKGWSPEIHAILKVTEEHEMEQRDLFDRPPSAIKPWTDGKVALLGDGIHAMMPNLGQGGCQAIEDAYVLAQELEGLQSRKQVADALVKYQRRRLVRSAAVQGLSRFASDIIIRGFDTPAKIVRDEESGQIRFENFNYAGIVTKMLQPILPIFFSVQFNFLYDGYENKRSIDVPAFLGFTLFGSILLLVLSFELAEVGLGLGLSAEALLGAEGLIDADAITTALQGIWPF